MQKRSFLFLCTPFLMLSVSARTPIVRKKPRVSSCTVKEGPITIFVHGTIIPIISHVLRLQERVKGIVPYKSCTSGIKRIASLLEEGAPHLFACDSFYSFGWSGNLSFAERKKAALQLYTTLSDHKGPKTIICHSHGCSVGLNLASIAKELKSESSFCVDTLILFAPPVQIATAPQVKSPIFKQVLSFYSSADLMQIADPQGLYDESKAASIDRNPPLLSQRKFPDSPNLIQTRVLLNWQSPGHRAFVLPRFIKKLPAMVTLLQEATKNGQRDVIINIPPRECLPHLVEKRQIARSYTPRSARSCRCATHRIALNA